jgi:hypothetical protein
MRLKVAVFMAILGVCAPTGNAAPRPCRADEYLYLFHHPDDVRCFCECNWGFCFHGELDLRVLEVLDFHETAFPEQVPEKYRPNLRASGFDVRLLVVPPAASENHEWTVGLEMMSRDAFQLARAHSGLSAEPQAMPRIWARIATESIIEANWEQDEAGNGPATPNVVMVPVRGASAEIPLELATDAVEAWLLWMGTARPRIDTERLREPEGAGAWVLPVHPTAYEASGSHWSSDDLCVTFKGPPEDGTNKMFVELASAMRDLAFDPKSEELRNSVANASALLRSAVTTEGR